jgi:hypothetical protein
MNELQEKVRRYMTDLPEYRQQNKKYCGYEMKMMDQEVLIAHLKEMNLKELQYCQGCGIPGHANTIALQLIRLRKKEMDEYLKTKGSVPIEKVESEVKQVATGEFKPDGIERSFSTNDAPEEAETDGESRVQTSKEGRNSDSEAV